MVILQHDATPCKHAGMLLMVVWRSLSSPQKHSILMVMSRSWWCSGSCSSPGASMQRESIKWCVNGMSTSQHIDYRHLPGSVKSLYVNSTFHILFCKPPLIYVFIMTFFPVSYLLYPHLFLSKSIFTHQSYSLNQHFTYIRNKATSFSSKSHHQAMTELKPVALLHIHVKCWLRLYNW
jgi:hypothetical protein